MKHLFFFVTACLVLAIACSNAAPRCLKSNCNGCCDVNGACQRGNDNFACGFGAGMCTSCAQNEGCVDGVCMTGAGGSGGSSGTGGGTSSGDGGCSSATCGGCCDMTGTCRGGNTGTTCGTGGIACATCPGGQACQSNDAGMFSCKPFVCMGCLSTTGNCLLGTNVGACGTGGAACMACLTGQTCTNGMCVQANTCTPQNCPNGCCNGTQCVDPPTSNQCGKMGAACSACSPPMVCNQGVCATGGTGGGSGGTGGGSGSGCNAQNCATGCCAFSICFPGNDNTACGTGGATCFPCGLIGLNCTANQCQ